LFLPFDLDQFEYDTIPGRTRADQLDAFKHQNEMVRKVAALGNSPGGPSVVNQLDKWYMNSTKQATADKEVFEAYFNAANEVITDWNVDVPNFNVYQTVVRPFCRNCHMANAKGRTFETRASFNNLATTIAADICGYGMPHSLQTLREFWFSNGPANLAAYWNGHSQGAAATTLSKCGPGSVATLDPQKIQSTFGGAL
jgi:RNase P subunit RPR2